MNFTILGNIKLGKEKRKFTKTVTAESENAAKDKVYALFGSQNGVKRSMIKIEKIEKK